MHIGRIGESFVLGLDSNATTPKEKPQMANSPLKNFWTPPDWTFLDSQMKPIRVEQAPSLSFLSGSISNTQSGEMIDSADSYYCIVCKERPPSYRISLGCKENAHLELWSNGSRPFSITLIVIIFLPERPRCWNASIAQPVPLSIPFLPEFLRRTSIRITIISIFMNTNPTLFLFLFCILSLYIGTTIGYINPGLMSLLRDAFTFLFVISQEKPELYTQVAVTPEFIHPYLHILSYQLLTLFDCWICICISNTTVFIEWCFDITLIHHLEFLTTLSLSEMLRYKAMPLLRLTTKLDFLPFSLSLPWNNLSCGCF